LRLGYILNNVTSRNQAQKQLSKNLVIKQGITIQPANKNSYLSHNNVSLLHTDTGIQMNNKTSTGRKHVETEESLNSVLNFPQLPFELNNFVTGEFGTAQIISIKKSTGESTQRVVLKKVGTHL
jgi:hypothetical protein